MKKFLLTSFFILGAMLSFQSVAATSSMMSVVPSSMQTDMQNVTQMKVKKMGNKMMYLGIKLYVMGKMMMGSDATTAKTMMSNGIKLYNMGSQMNGGNSMDMSQCMGRMKKNLVPSKLSQ